MKVCTVCGGEWADDINFCPNDGAGLRPVDAKDLVGTVVADRYRIIRKLGEGGMGAVYLGEHVKMRRPSAIKVLTQALAHNRDAVARFNREAANAARISHPNVCAIYDFGDSDGLIYLAMEYIEGETLSALLRRERRLAPQRASSIISQTADALQAAHDMGIVHRDLKPDNVMVTRGREGTDHVKVVDFGIAKAIGGGDEEQKVTKTGLVIGTPEYMSPEQLSGDVLDGRSDIYSLALVFYRAVTGRLPFQADTAQEVLIARLTDEPMPLHKAAPELEFPAALQTVLTRALQRMPADRFPTPLEFARNVQAAVQHMGPAKAPAAEAATQLVDTAAADPVPPTRLSPLSTPATPQPLEATRPSDAARPTPLQKKERGKKPVLIAAATIGVLAVVGGGAAVMLGGGRQDGATSRADSLGAAPAVMEDTAGLRGTNDAGVARPESAGIGEVGPPSAAQARSNPRLRDDAHTRPPADTGRDVAAGETGPRPLPPDVGAVADDLMDIGRRIESAALRGAARRAAVEWYDNVTVPDTLRARAASIIAESYDEEHDNQPTDACRWIGRAVGLYPDNAVYRQFQTLVLGCAR